MNYILCWGSPVDGCEFIGPFSSAEEAGDYASEDREISRGTWWVILLQEPAK